MKIIKRLWFAIKMISLLIIYILWVLIGKKRGKKLYDFMKDKLNEMEESL